MLREIVKDINQERNLIKSWDNNVIIEEEHIQAILSYNLEELHLIKKKLFNLAEEVAKKNHQHRIIIDQQEEILQTFNATHKRIMGETGVHISQYMRDDVRRILLSPILDSMTKREKSNWPHYNKEVDCFKIEDMYEFSMKEILEFYTSEETFLIKNGITINKDHVENFLMHVKHNKLSLFFELYVYINGGCWRPSFDINKDIVISSYEDFDTLYRAVLAYQDLVSVIITKKNDELRYLTKEEIDYLYTDYLNLENQADEVLESTHSHHAKYIALKEILKKGIFKDSLEEQLKESNKTEDKVTKI